jgi:hypothetical protein
MKDIILSEKNQNICKKQLTKKIYKLLYGFVGLIIQPLLAILGYIIRHIKQASEQTS